MTEQQRQQWKDALAANARANRRNQTRPRRASGLAAVNGAGRIRITPARGGTDTPSTDHDDDDAA